MAKGDIITPEGTGHVDNLTPDQKVALMETWRIIMKLADVGEAEIPAEKSKVSVASLGMSIDKLRPILWDNIMGDNPDALVLRFLRARKWNKTNAMNMMLKAFKWRLDEDIPAVKYSTDTALDKLYPKFLEQMVIGKFYLHGTDNEGRPVAYLNVKLHRAGDQPAKTLEKLTIYIIEAGRVLLQHPAETVCLVFDLTGFTLANADFTMVRYLVTIFEAHYPESLGRIVIHGAPFVFWGVWKIVQPWLDPVVAGKVRFTRSDQELGQHIPPEHIPCKYKGGLDKYVYQYIHAKEGENKCMEDTVTRDRLVEEWKNTMWKFEALTKEWVAEDSAGRPASVVEAERAQVVKDLRRAFFAADPYVRARNIFHRSDPPIAHADGSVTWIYDN